MTIDSSSRPSPSAAASPAPSAASQRLRDGFAAARVSFTWLGVRRTLSPVQKQQAAEPFGAEGQYLSAAKKLLDVSHPAYRQVTAVRTRAVSYWRGCSLPYPEPGLRLVRQDRLNSFDRQMRELDEELDQAVKQLDDRYAELKQQARQRLGQLYDERDYPPSLVGLFSLQWDFPSVQPPDYLLRLNPQLYEQEKARFTARFEEAVRLAEQAFTGEFAQLVGHLTERLSGSGPDGKAKVFRDSAVENLREFFGRFRQLNVRSSPQLDDLVEQARRAVAGVGPQALRDSQSLRQQISSQLTACSPRWRRSWWTNPGARSCGRPGRGVGEMELVIRADGTVRCVYGEEIDLCGLGEVTIRRASHVEPDEQGGWWADLSPVGGPTLGPFTRRSKALDAERLWLESHLAAGK